MAEDCLYGPITRQPIILTSNKTGGLKLLIVNVFDKFLCRLVKKCSTTQGNH